MKNARSKSNVATVADATLSLPFQSVADEIIELFDRTGPYPWRSRKKLHSKVVEGRRSALITKLVLSRPGWGVTVRAAVLRIVESGVPGQPKGQVVGFHYNELVWIVAFRIAEQILGLELSDRKCGSFIAIVDREIQNLIANGLLVSKRQYHRLQRLEMSYLLLGPEHSSKHPTRVKVAELLEVFAECVAIQVATSEIALSIFWFVIFCPEILGAPGISDVSNFLVKIELMTAKNRENQGSGWYLYIKGLCDESIRKREPSSAVVEKFVTANALTVQIYERALSIFQECDFK